MLTNIAIIVTAYKPSSEFLNMWSYLAKCGLQVFISDNTPGGSSILLALAKLEHNIILLQGEKNDGLGKALNDGINKAKKMGFKYIMLLDQDTEPTITLINNLKDTHELLSKKYSRPLVISPAFSNRSLHYENQNREIEALDQVSCLPTAGMFFEAKHWKSENGFSQEFFMDLTDFEWCWRMKSKGWLFFQHKVLKIKQVLGEGSTSFFKLKINIPSPFRHYFQFRDTLRISCMKHVPIKSKIRFLIVLPIKIILYPLILENGRKRLIWMLLGIKDFFLKVHGIGSASFLLNKIDED